MNKLLLLLLLVPTLSVAQTRFEVFERALDSSIENVDEMTTSLLNGGETINKSTYNNMTSIINNGLLVAEYTQEYQKTPNYLAEPLESQWRLNEKVLMLASALRLMIETLESKHVSQSYY